MSEYLELANCNQPLQVSVKVGEVNCNAIFDSGSSSSLISEEVVNRIPHVRYLPVKQSLVTAAGDAMTTIGEAELEIRIKDFHTRHKFIIVSSLITDCILGVDFLSRHEVQFDFAIRTITGPKIGKLKADTSNNDDINQMCSLHDETYPEAYATVILNVEEDWECRCAVPQYGSRPTTQLPICSPEFLKIVEDFSDLFKSIPGVAKVEEFRIITPNAAPSKTPSRMVPQAYRSEVHTQLEDMLERGVNKLSNIPWLSSPVVVGKKDGGIRFCIDYINLNKVTQKDAYPLPLPDQVQDKLNGACIFSKLDLNSGYWQIPVAECDREKNAFSVGPGLGIYEFNVLPFGLIGGPSICQRIMDQVLRGMDCIDNFIDDILIFSPDEHSHRIALQEVFKRLRKHNFTLRGKKCEVGKRSITYLGHTFSKSVMSPDQSKLEAIEHWPRPSDQKDVKQFLGLASYYRRYIKEFAVVAGPLNQLLAKYIKFSWNDSAEESFFKLKRKLVSASVLNCPDFKKKFTLCTDASGLGLGAVLEQDNHAVAYYSRSLRNSERNYSTIELECLAMVEALKRLRHYLLGRQFEILTDHKPLESLSEQKSNGRLWRWAVIIQEYDFTIKYRKGHDNGNADALSRLNDRTQHEVDNIAETNSKQDLQYEHCAITGITRFPDIEMIKGHLKQDKIIGKVVAELTHFPIRERFSGLEWKELPLRKYKQLQNQLSLKEGTLVRDYKVGPFSDSSTVVVIPDSLKLEMLSQVHDDAAHQGIE